MSNFRVPLALAASALAFACLPARADDTPAPPSESDTHAASPFDLGLSVGTAGLGADLSLQVIPRALAIRAVVNALSYSHGTTSDDVDYKGKLKLDSQWLLLDWAPFFGHFRFSGGLVINHNALRLDGKPSGPGDTYVINGNTYQLSDLTARVNFRKTAPYVGLGYRF